jgi:hypothetical protein
MGRQIICLSGSPTLQFLYRMSTATISCAFTRCYFAVFTSSKLHFFFSFVPLICCFIYSHLKSCNTHIANDTKTGEVLVERTVY